MLLNEFLKEHQKVEKQEATIMQLKNDFQTVSTQQRKEIQLLSAQLKEQAAQIQKVRRTSLRLLRKPNRSAPPNGTTSSTHSALRFPLGNGVEWSSAKFFEFQINFLPKSLRMRARETAGNVE
jgi:hypothetical protein